MFRWVIKDFKSVRHRIESPEFESGGCRWCVVVHPNVDNCISMCLLVSGCEDLPPGWKIHAKYWLSIESRRYKRRAIDSVARCFDSEGPAWGLSNWLHRSQLDDGVLDPHGDLKIDVRVEVLHKSDPMFTWVIKDFKSVLDRRIIKSPEFESGGCRWCVAVYPNRDKGHNSMSMCLAVAGYQDMPPGWKIHAKLWLSIESPSEHRGRAIAITGAERCFDSEGLAWGLPNCLLHSELNDGFLDLNGDLKIEAHVEVLHKSGV